MESVGPFCGMSFGGGSYTHSSVQLSQSPWEPWRIRGKKCGLNWNRWELSSASQVTSQLKLQEVTPFSRGKPAVIPPLGGRGIAASLLRVLPNALVDGLENCPAL